MKVWPNWYGSGFFVPGGRRNWREFHWHHGLCSHFTAWQIRFVVFGWHYYIVFRGGWWIKRWGEKKRKEFLDRRPLHRAG